MPRILCVWLPLWPIQRLRSVQPEVKRRPLALYASTSRGERLTVCSPIAARQGLRPGMSRSEAEVLAGEVALLPAGTAADLAALTDLALLCQSRFSPATALEESDTPECLFLDIEGCAHLFRGEQGLVREVLHCFRSESWRLRCGMAETIGIAWALARFAGKSVTIASPGQGESDSAPAASPALHGRMLNRCSETPGGLLSLILVARS